MLILMQVISLRTRRASPHLADSAPTDVSSSATRMMLRKGKGDERTAKLQDSPDMPEAEATYCLKSG